MSNKANVTDIQALEQFRSSLVLFLERTCMILDEVSEEVKRTRIWLQSEQRMTLEHAAKRKNREMDALQQEMFTARMSKLANAKTGVEMQINRKRREIREVEEKLRAVAGWLRNFDSSVETEARKVEKLTHLIDADMKKALTFLSESIRNLEAYTSGEGP